MKRKLFSMLALLCLTVSGAWADGSWTSGDCTVTLSDAGVLTVSGTGAMADYTDITGLPWRSSRTSITSIVINDGVTSIGAHAFDGCKNTNLTSVSIPETVTNIGKYAFANCTYLATITIPNPNSVTSIGSSAFAATAWDKNNETAGIGLLYIGNVAYKYYGTMPENTHIAIEDKTLEIACDAFSGKTTLKSITIPNTVTNIGDNAFYGCSNLGTVTIEGNSLKTIGTYAFYNCRNLETVTIPNSVTSIGSDSFKNCIRLGTFTIPNNVGTINNNIFQGCTNLTSVTIPNSVTSIGQTAFQGCTNLTSVTIPNSVTSIGSNAFYGCSKLETVTIYAQSCSLVNATVFKNTNLANIYVFNDVTGNYTSGNWTTYSAKITAIPDLTANSDETGNYWTTYYNDLTCATAPEGTQVFKVALSGSTLTLTEISDRVINMGEGVVLKSNSPSITLASAASTGTTADGGYEGNVLTGTMTEIANPSYGSVYVLNKTTENGVGFYKLSSDGTIGANKAYLTSTAGAREFFLFDDATGIEAIENGQSTIDAVVYDLQGRRVSQPAKGLYIVNGKKYIKK